LLVALGIATVVYLVVLVVWGAAPFAFSFDDAFYYFTIGRNWAAGHVSTFDQLDRTNGYHPLWQLISTVPYLFGLDGLAAVRFLLVVQLALWAGAMALVARIIVQSVDGWSRLEARPDVRRFCDAVVVIAYVAVIANPYLFKMTVNGLESGLVVPVGAALLAFATGFRGRFVSQTTPRQRLVAGGLLALAFLARTDAVILLAPLGVWTILDGGKPVLEWTTRVRRIVEIFIVPAVVITTYLVVNRVFFDTALQISGSIKRLPLTPLRGALALVWAAIGLALLLAARRPVKRSTRAPLVRRFFSITAWYAAFCVGLLGYYTTLQSVPYLWYFAPLALYGTLVIVLAVADLAQGAVLEATRASRPPRGAAVRAPALILCVPLVVALAWSVPSIVDPGARALMVHDAAAGRWIGSHLPPDARIASWDAGTLGYFSDRKVVNLDGVVNSHDWYEALQQGRTAEFLAARDVDWVANHGSDVKGRDPDIDAQIRSLFGDDAIRRVTVVYRDTYTYSGTLDGSRTDTSSKHMGTYVYRLDRAHPGR
jgi:predicted secreted protein